LAKSIDQEDTMEVCKLDHPLAEPLPSCSALWPDLVKSPTGPDSKGDLASAPRRGVFIVGRTGNRIGGSGYLGWQDAENQSLVPAHARDDVTDRRDLVVDALTIVLEFAYDQTVPCPLFVTSIRAAIHAHLAHAYGKMGNAGGMERQGLAPWQERRAKRCLTANVGDDVSVAGAAAACKLSRSYFIRAFKITTGETPHRWLCRYRIEKAKALLLGARPIAEIAVDCGFADQSHLTRAFAKMIGVPPGVWRREYRGAGQASPDGNADAAFSSIL
jgi:AraC-like DNA-binding protein